MYWAFSVMTGLKGWAAHENRTCFVSDMPLVTSPLLERIYTILTFIIGAIVYASVFGNVARCGLLRTA